jgi:cation diffusion facilitator CzcD-associated flavoprotein CzcO
MYSFEPKHDWSCVYASPPELKGYFTGFCAKYKLSNYIRLSHVVQKATWNEIEGEWQVDILDTSSGETIRDRCHILIHACGSLDKPAYPNIPGREEFKGSMAHTGNWDASLKLEGKTVALIGSGSSALQVLPAIQPSVKRVTNFVRSPIWVLPTISSAPTEFTKENIRDFRAFPDKHTDLRKYNETVVNSIYRELQPLSSL